MRTKHDRDTTLQTLDLRALEAVVGGDADTDRDLITDAGGRQDPAYKLCQDAENAQPSVSLHRWAECIRGHESGARLNARNFANSLN